MTRILVAECKQEVSSFNPIPSSLADFETLWGAAFLDYHRGLNSEMAGALGVFESRADIELVPAYSARSITSGGTLAAEEFTQLAAEFLALVQAAGPVDGVYYSLHGAMAAENESDPEGYLLAETRKIVGERIPIVISLDLHHQRTVSELIDEQRRTLGTAVVFVTHDVNPILPFVDKVLYLAGGRFRVGTPDEVLRSEVLSYMYDTPVEVIRSRGRVAVLGAPEGYGVHDHLEHHERPSGVLG